MNRPAHSVASILLTLVVATAAYAEEPKSKGFLKKMFTGPDLPVELTTEVDVFHSAWLVTPKRPFTFAPFKLTDLQRSAPRIESEGRTVFVLGRGGGRTAVAADRSYSFTMNESDQPQWECHCEFWSTRDSVQAAVPGTSMDMTLSGQSSLHCEFAKPGGEPVWSLDHNMKELKQGMGVSLTGDGRLFSETGEFTVTPLMVVENSQVLGDLAGGYVFKAGGTPVAAVVFQNGIPRRIIVHRSVTPADRSLLVAATAALTFGDPLLGQRH
jgi:hypothetical protein